MGHLGKQVVSTENEDYLLAKVEGLLQVGTSVGLHSETLHLLLEWHLLPIYLSVSLEGIYRIPR